MNRVTKFIPVLALVGVIGFSGLAHAQTVSSGATSTMGTSGTTVMGSASTSAAMNTGSTTVTTTTMNTTMPGSVSGTAMTSVPGTPNTGEGGAAPFNLALLFASGLAALVGISYLARVKTR
jgi:hypothetical protein